MSMPSAVLHHVHTALIEHATCQCYAEQSASDARTLLRKGSFSGLRDTVRSVLSFCFIIYAPAALENLCWSIEVVGLRHLFMVLTPANHDGEVSCNFAGLWVSLLQRQACRKRKQGSW